MQLLQIGLHTEPKRPENDIKGKATYYPYAMVNFDPKEKENTKITTTTIQ